jgi:hypothetical protein
MAQLNFPDPSVTTTYIEAGITWTWNATLGVWSSDPNDFDSDYLKLDATNGPVTGPLTFEGLTTHEGGVSVTGGNLVINPGQIKQGATTSAAAAGSGVQIKGFVRQYCNETDFPEGDKNDEQPFQVISAPNDASTKEVVLSLNASGSAYFKGNIDCDGLINGAFSLRMQSDDPAAFTTTYSTDDEGNQVENQTYVGTTESLLDIVRELRAANTALETRLAALEGA